MCQKKSDDKLITELFNSYRHMMYKIALGILHNKSDAEDVVQDAFLYIINNLEKILQIPCNKRACYFANITEHLSLNVINKRRRHPANDIDEYEDLDSDIFVEETALQNLTIDEMKRAIDKMSAKDRLFLQLYFFEEKSYAEISEIAGISGGNARVCVHRARKRLIKILKKRGIEYDI